jgi:hypothetical protein
MPDSVLPENLKGKKHWDWPWPFSRIPRAWTSFDWGPPKLLLRHGLTKEDFQEGIPKPINGPGGVQVSYFPGAPWWAKPFAWYVAYSLPQGKDGKFHHLRLGARYDNVDKYTTFPTFPTTRKYTGNDSQNTST